MFHNTVVVRMDSDTGRSYFETVYEHVMVRSGILETDRQTDIQTDRQKDRKSDKCVWECRKVSM